MGLWASSFRGSCLWCSIVVSQSSSLPEVVGDCAVFANPYDYRDIARALEQGLNDEKWD